MEEGAMHCPGCGGSRARVRELKKYRYLESGLDNVWLEGGVLQYTCPDCGQTHVHVLAERQLLQLIAVDLLQKPFGLTGRETRYLRSICDLTQERLAKHLGVTRATVIERERGRRVDPAAEYFFRAVILMQFLGLLANKDKCHLSAKQLEQLEEFRCEFVHLAIDPPKRRTARVRVISDNRAWELPAAA
jgi:DNA-binding XRE family transcriptional regulator